MIFHGFFEILLKILHIIVLIGNLTSNQKQATSNLN
jgi:hypothetical protein